MNDQTAPHVYSAINAVSAALSKEGIEKARRNQQQGYAFRGIDDVYNALACHLAANKLVIIPRCLSRVVTERNTAKGGVLFYVVVDCEFDFVSAVDGSKHTSRHFGEAMDSGDKATNKAMSAAYKYAAMQAFCIPTEGDNDADASTHTPARLQEAPHQGAQRPAAAPSAKPAPAPRTAPIPAQTAPAAELPAGPTAEQLAKLREFAEVPAANEVIGKACAHYKVQTPAGLNPEQASKVIARCEQVCEAAGV